MTTDPPSPSEPVESREQPREADEWIDAGGWEIKPEPGEIRTYVPAELLREARATLTAVRELADYLCGYNPHFLTAA